MGYLWWHTRTWILAVIWNVGLPNKCLHASCMWMMGNISLKVLSLNPLQVLHFIKKMLFWPIPLLRHVVYIFFPPTCRQRYEKLKLDWMFSSKAISLKFGEYTLLPIIFIFLFIYWLEFIFFKESYMSSDSQTNTVNLRLICWSTQNAARGTIFLRTVDWPCSKRAGDWERTYLFLVQIFNIHWIKNGASYLKEHPKISKFTTFDGFKRKGMVRF